jgi:hypothetical protein
MMTSPVVWSEARMFRLGVSAINAVARQLEEIRVWPQPCPCQGERQPKRESSWSPASEDPSTTVDVQGAA